MTEEAINKSESADDIEVIIRGQIAALRVLVNHLLCLSTIRVALDRGDTNFIRVTREIEEIVRQQTASFLDGDYPPVAEVAKRLQKEIFDDVKSQMKKELRVLRVAISSDKAQTQ